jgi:hypothetical protein
MTSCHCPISVICLVCKGEDLTPRYLVLACEPFVSAGAGRETLCELARIAVRRESRRTNGVCSATCVSHTPAAACRRCWPSCARPSSSYERCPCLQFAPAGHTAQEPGRRSAAQHGRARSGVDSSLAGPLRARPWAGRRCAGVLARSWRECTARARQQDHNKRAGGRATRQSENRGLQLRQLFRVHRHLGGRHSQRLLRSSTSRRPRLWEQHELKNPKTYFCGGAPEGRFVICDAVGQGREA